MPMRENAIKKKMLERNVFIEMQNWYYLFVCKFCFYVIISYNDLYLVI